MIDEKHRREALQQVRRKGYEREAGRSRDGIRISSEVRVWDEVDS